MERKTHCCGLPYTWIYPRPSKDLSAGIKKCNRGVNYEVLQRSVRARIVSEALSAQTVSSPGTRPIIKPSSGTA